MLKFTSIVGYTSCEPTYIKSFFTIFGQCINVLNYNTCDMRIPGMICVFPVGIHILLVICVTPFNMAAVLCIPLAFAANDVVNWRCRNNICVGKVCDMCAPVHMSLVICVSQWGYTYHK